MTGKLLLASAALATMLVGSTAASAQDAAIRIQSRDYRESVVGLPFHSYGYRWRHHYRGGYGAYAYAPGYYGHHYWRHHWRRW
jgi:hypothetical protein